MSDTVWQEVQVAYVGTGTRPPGMLQVGDVVEILVAKGSRDRQRAEACEFMHQKTLDTYDKVTNEPRARLKKE